MLDELVLLLEDKGMTQSRPSSYKPHHDNVQVGEKCPSVFKIKKRVKENMK